MRTINTYPYPYQTRAVSKTDEMLKAVFRSPAVLLIIIFLAIMCAVDIYFAVTAYGFTDRFFDSDNFYYYIDALDGYNSDYSTEEMYIAMKTVMSFMSFIFMGVAVGHVWAMAGTLTVYLRAKNEDSSIRAGFTVLQVFAITKLVLSILPLLFMMLASWFALTENILSFVIMLLPTIFITVRIISLIVAVSGVKRTIDGISYTPSGTGALRFSAFGIGIITILSGLLSLGAVLRNMNITEDLPKAVIDELMSFMIFLIVCIGYMLIYAIIHFLIFIVAGHYSRKLRLAVNAEYAYQQNMANLYPDTYNGFQQENPFSPYKQPYQNHPPYQPPYDNNSSPNPDITRKDYYSDGF